MVEAGKETTMTIGDVLGYALIALLLGGFAWALIDLLVKIAKKPKSKKPFSFLRLTSYPFVPEYLEEELEREQPRFGGHGGRRLSPVPIRHRDERH